MAIEGIGALRISSSGADAGPGEKDVTGYTYVIGADVLYHWNVLDDAASYLGAGVVWQGDKPGGIVTIEADAKNSLDLNLLLGGEYFLSDHFSLGIKAEEVLQLGFSRDVPDEPGTDFDLMCRTNITGRLYF